MPCLFLIDGKNEKRKRGRDQGRTGEERVPWRKEGKESTEERKRKEGREKRKHRGIKSRRAIKERDLPSENLGPVL